MAWCNTAVLDIAQDMSQTMPLEHEAFGTEMPKSTRINERNGVLIQPSIRRSAHNWCRVSPLALSSGARTPLPLPLRA